MTAITQENNTWKFSGNLVVDNITEVLAQAQTLELQSETQLDFSEVGEVDTSAISLVLELQRKASQSGGQVFLNNPPENLTTLMALYGVEDFIASA